MNIKMYKDVIYIWLMGILIFIGVGLLFSIPLTLLWNWLMPNIFGLPTINILEAFGLSMLATLLSSKPIELNKSTTNKNNFNVDKFIEKAKKKSEFEA